MDRSLGMGWAWGRELREIKELMEIDQCFAVFNLEETLKALIVEVFIDVC